MKATGRKKLMAIIWDEFRITHINTSEDFNGDDSGIVLASEFDDSEDGHEPIFDYSGDEDKYEEGVRMDFSEFIKKEGWVFAWVDCGHVILHKN
tara:strand:- start:290 stop:571 length:282 start_codon:yes stop_codon:yes gene_type:complete